jgi:arylsulfatase A-like enzyme
VSRELHRRAGAFICGQNPIRTGLTKVGMPGATVGLHAEDPTIATALKAHGYAPPVSSARTKQQQAFDGRHQPARSKAKVVKKEDGENDRGDDSAGHRPSGLPLGGLSRPRMDPISAAFVGHARWST